MTFDLTPPLILENSRAELSPLTENDYGALFSFSSSEPQLWDFSLISASGSENLKKYIQKAMLEKKEKRAYPFLVYDKLTKQIAGSTRFYNIDFHHQTLNIGYTWYGKKFQQTGLNRNCKLLLLSHAFEVWNMERVEFRADAKNSKSIAAMLAIGCTHEGTLRNNCRSISTRRDSVVLSILKSEWEGGIKKQLEGKIY